VRGRWATGGGAAALERQPSEKLDPATLVSRRRPDPRDSGRLAGIWAATKEDEVTEKDESSVLLEAKPELRARSGFGNHPELGTAHTRTRLGHRGLENRWGMGEGRRPPFVAGPRPARHGLRPAALVELAVRRLETGGRRVKARVPGGGKSIFRPRPRCATVMRCFGAARTFPTRRRNDGDLNRLGFSTADVPGGGFPRLTDPVAWANGKHRHAAGGSTSSKEWLRVSSSPRIRYAAAARDEADVRTGFVPACRRESRAGARRGRCSPAAAFSEGRIPRRRSRRRRLPACTRPPRRGAGRARTRLAGGSRSEVARPQRFAVGPTPTTFGAVPRSPRVLSPRGGDCYGEAARTSVGTRRHRRRWIFTRTRSGTSSKVYRGALQSSNRPRTR